MIELLLGLSLALCLAVGVAPLFTSAQSLAAGQADETTWTLQARVAMARFERDMRLAGAGGASFPASGAILSGTSSQVVLLVQAEQAETPLLVEWEVVNGSLMRRWGWCPSTFPSTFSHSLYADNKTMLEHVDTARSALSYATLGARLSGPLSAAEMPLISEIGLEVCALVGDGAERDPVASVGRVGR